MRKNHKKRGPKNNGDSSGGSWEVIYSGFVLILLCFFIMINSFSTIQKTKLKSFMKSFSNAVCILPGGVKFESGEEVLNISEDIVDKESELADLYEHIRAFTHKLGLEKQVDLSFVKKTLVMRLSDTVLFDIGIAEILPESLPLLEKIGSIIAKTSYSIRIEGHTDDLPIHTDSFPSNWELSTARAVNVLRYFIEKEKISPKRISAAGYGEFQPIYSNDTPENRAKNRRVEIVFAEAEQEKQSKELRR